MLKDKEELEVNDNPEIENNFSFKIKLFTYLKSIIPTTIIGLLSFVIIFLLHFFGAYNSLELKLYDLRLKLRGPISGTDSKSALPNDEKWIDMPEPFIDKNKNSIRDLAEKFIDIGNGVWDEGEEFIDIGNGIWDEGENFIDFDGNGKYDEWDEYNDIGNGVWDEGEEFIDIGNGVWDEGEEFIDIGNGIWDEGEKFEDYNGNGKYDADEWEEFTDLGNGIWDDAEDFDDINNNNKFDFENNIYDIGIDSLYSNGIGCWEEEVCINGQYDIGEEFTDLGNGKWDSEEPFEDKNNNKIWDSNETYTDFNGNNKWDSAEEFIDIGNGVWDEGEQFIDIGNGIWDEGEPFLDFDGNEMFDADWDEFTDVGNGVWDEGEQFIDIGNGVWDEGEKFIDSGNGIRDEGENYIDVDDCDKLGKVCHNEKCVEYKECHDINQNGKWDKGLDVVIVERDDESFRLIPDPLPYSRANVWARVVKNLTDVGAKIIVFDFVFDKPDHQTKNLKSYMKTNELEFPLIDGDEKFIESVEYAELNGTKVILASKIAYEESRIPPTYYLPPYKNLINDKRVNITAGTVNIPTDVDGFNRRYMPIGVAPSDTNLYPALAIQTVIQYLGIINPSPKFNGTTVSYGPYGDNQFLEIDSYGTYGNGFLINFLGPPSGSSLEGNAPFNTFRRISLSNILDTEEYELDDEDQNWMDLVKIGFISPNPFKDKIVIIGTSMAEDQDFTLAPFSNYKGKEFQFPGVEYHANAIQHLLDNNYIKSPFGTLEFNTKFLTIHLAIIAILILITLVSVSKAPPLWGFLIMATGVIGWIYYCISAFITDYLWLYKIIVGIDLDMVSIGGSSMVPILFPISSIILPFGINLTYKLFTEGQDKAFLKASFGSYISPELIDQMFESKQEPSLGGEEGYNTAFFSDIASFSTFSEKLSAPDLVELLNEYLNEMTNILLNNNGTLDKYIGDAIIAFYGAPVDLEDHEYLACLTCCQMNDKLEELRRKWQSEGERWPEIVHNMRHRIGVNCGSLVTGNMGSDMRMNYTMMGDTVNLTARLESGAKQYGIETQVGEKIYEACKDRFTFRMLDYVIVKGRSTPERTYELISEKGKEPIIYNEILPLWNQAIEQYTNQSWDEAIKSFKKCDKLEEVYIGRPTTPCKFYISRCEEYKQNPPGEDWDGAYKLTSK